VRGLCEQFGELSTNHVNDLMNRTMELERIMCANSSSASDDITMFGTVIRDLSHQALGRP
jgi:hypothetical protein